MLGIWYRLSNNNIGGEYFLRSMEMTQFFSVARSNNDLNVLNQFISFTHQLQGQDLIVNFQVSGRYYILGYYLVDDIYTHKHTHINNIMYTCIILHNMIVEDERNDDYEGLKWLQRPIMDDINYEVPQVLTENILQINVDIHNILMHQQLKENLPSISCKILVAIKFKSFK